MAAWMRPQVRGPKLDGRVSHPPRTSKGPTQMKAPHSPVMPSAFQRQLMDRAALAHIDWRKASVTHSTRKAPVEARGSEASLARTRS
jgi:hypothetical protein